jgi:hypothetical protein
VCNVEWLWEVDGQLCKSRNRSRDMNSHLRYALNGMQLVDCKSYSSYDPGTIRHDTGLNLETTGKLLFILNSWAAYNWP